MGEFNVNKTTGDLEQTAGADNEAKANRIDIAPDFDDTVAYAMGDLVYYQGTLYEFNQAHAAGAWNSAEVDARDISDVLKGYAPKNYQLYNEITANGVKTYKELINDLFSGTTNFGFYDDWYISINQIQFKPFYTASTHRRLTSIYGLLMVHLIDYMPKDTTGTSYKICTFSGNTMTVSDESSTVPPDTTILRVYAR